MPKYMFCYDSINDHLVPDGQDLKALLELVKYMKHREQQLTTQNKWSKYLIVIVLVREWVERLYS